MNSKLFHLTGIILLRCCFIGVLCKTGVVAQIGNETASRFLLLWPISWLFFYFFICYCLYNAIMCTMCSSCSGACWYWYYALLTRGIHLQSSAHIINHVSPIILTSCFCVTISFVIFEIYFTIFDDCQVPLNKTSVLRSKACLLLRRLGCGSAGGKEFIVSILAA